MQMVAFDIDDTLANSTEFDSRLLVGAVRSVYGIEVNDDWFSYRSVTDSGILEEIMYKAGVRPERVLVHARVRRISAGLAAGYIGDRGVPS
ncbi:MAG: hypothetical protein F4109_10100 [Gammaproteobacteria bacterium]|nr:hypothetical protein [Gammaproteobacteria bacterium]